MTTRGVKLQVTGLVAAILTAAIMGWLLQRTVLIPPDLDILSIPRSPSGRRRTSCRCFSPSARGWRGDQHHAWLGIDARRRRHRGRADSARRDRRARRRLRRAGAALAAAVLVAVNLLAINLSALILFYAAGFRPADTIEVESIRKAVASRVIVIATAIAVLSLVLALVTVATYHTQSFEQETQAELQAAFAEADIEGVELVEVTVDYELVDVLLGNEPEVNVLVGIPRDFPTPPGLAQRFDDELTERLGQDVFVQVGFIEAEFSEREPPEPPLGFEAVFAVSTD